MKAVVPSPSCPRSQAQPLVFDADNAKCRSSLSVVRAVGAQSERIKALRIKNDEHAYLVKYMPVEPNFKILQYLDYAADDWNWNGGFPGGANDILNWLTLPGLRRLELRRWRACPENEDEFPWSRLRNLYLDDFTGQVGCLLLAIPECTNLVELKISTKSPDPLPEQPNTADAVILHNLRHLGIKVLEITVTNTEDTSRVEDFLRRILSRISAPALSSISLIETSSSSDPSESVLRGIDDIVHGFLARCGKVQLAEFSMWPNDEYDIRLLAFLLDQASVKTLVVRRAGRVADCDFLLKRILSGREDEREPILFPSLRHLRLVDLKFDPVLLVQLIGSRQKEDNEDVDESNTTSDSENEEQAATLTSDTTNNSANISTVLTPSDIESLDGVLNRVEIEYNAPSKTSKRKPTLLVGAMRHFTETVIRTGLSACKLHPSFNISFDPR